ncbi:ZIP family metal transporter [Roseibium algicola]|uniref:ZIP family metal transporter n=1 Tax=Roseibium algicola TaxID=2857014 RepID=UPI00345ADAFE
MGAVALMNERLPHEHFRTGREGPEAASLRRVWLFIIAITIHNFPEGLAVGVGFGSGGMQGGLPLAIGIGLQNAPEGLAVAVSLLGEGYPKLRAWGIATLTGMVEPIGGLLGRASSHCLSRCCLGVWPLPPVRCSMSSATKSSPKPIAADIRTRRHSD